MAFTPDIVPVKAPRIAKADESTTKDEVLEVANRFTTNVITYDYRTIDDDLRKLLEDTTPAFKTNFHTGLLGDINTYEASIRRRKAWGAGEVTSSSVTSIDDETASVATVFKRTFHNSASDRQRRAIQTFELTMIKTADGWKVDLVGVLSARD